MPHYLLNSDSLSNEGIELPEDGNVVLMLLWQGLGEIGDGKPYMFRTESNGSDK